MIFEIVLNLIFTILEFILTPLTNVADVAIPSDFADSITFIRPYYSSLDMILPVATLIALISIEVVFDGSMFVYKGIKWAYQKLPFIN